MLLSAIVGVIVAASPALAQFKKGGEEKPGGIKIGDKYEISRWQTGVVVKAVGGACKGIYGYIPVPYSWPEQEVSITKGGEDISSEVRVSYETVDGGARIMNVKIAQLPAGKEVKAVVTFEVRRNVILPPDQTDGYVFADVKKMTPALRAYLSPSPKIESRDPKIRELAKTIGADKEKAWDHVEAIYDWVREKVQYKPGALKGALAALRDGTGDCEEITSLFIAICRAANIPARTVWVHNHCYPEFYLLDEKGEGHWFPCQSAGSREFGGIMELRPILQKGDNFRPPKNSRERQRYMAEFLTGSPTPGGGKPQVRFIREMLPK